MEQNKQCDKCNKCTPELSKTAVDDICPQCGCDRLDWGEKDYPDGDQVSVECTCYECGLDFLQWYTLKFDGQTVGEVGKRIDIRPKLDANARLIAAAPDLLAVLQAVYQDIELQNVKGGSDQLNFEVQEAIAKAETS